MKKIFYKNILFAAITVVILSSILLINPPQAFRYAYATDECMNRSAWIQQQMVSPKQYDIVFVGSSHTLNAINDSMLSALTNQSCINIGLCGLGENKNYILIKDWLTYHPSLPKKIILECNQWENTYSYGNYGYLAESKEIVASISTFNRNITSDLYKALKIRSDYLLAYFLAENGPQVNEIMSYGYIKNPLQLDSALAYRIIQKKKIKWAKETKESWLSDLEYSYPQHYIDLIAKLCKEKNIELVFIYLPSYGWPSPKPLHYQYLQRKSEVYIPPTVNSKNINYWAEDEHMSGAGSARVCSEIIEYLHQKK